MNVSARGLEPESAGAQMECAGKAARARRGLKFSPGCSSEWFLKAAGAPAKTHTDPHSSALCDQP